MMTAGESNRVHCLGAMAVSTAVSPETPCLWPTPPSFSRNLPPNTIHVWCVDLGEFAINLSESFTLLSVNEQARAARFRFPQHRNAFVIQHGLLRTILGRYLSATPASLTFRTSANGKPSLDLGDAPPLHFNLSHSGDLVLYAFSWAAPVGVDIERIRPMPDLREIAARCFTEKENAFLLGLPPEEQTGAFFNGWTRKEAYLKATGQGIGAALAEVEVSLSSCEVARLVSVKRSERAAAGWSLHALQPATGYAAALAYSAPALNVSTWSLVSTKKKMLGSLLAVASLDSDN